MSTHADAVTAIAIGHGPRSGARDRGSASRPTTRWSLPSGATSWRRVIAIPVDDDVVAMMTYDIGELVDAPQPRRRAVAAQLRHRRDHEPRQRARRGSRPRSRRCSAIPPKSWSAAAPSISCIPTTSPRWSNGSSRVADDASIVPTVELRLAAFRRRVPVVPVLDREPARRSRRARRRAEHARHRRPPPFRGRAAHVGAADAQHPGDRGRRDHHERRHRAASSSSTRPRSASSALVAPT